MPRLDDKRVDITEKDIKDALAMPRDFGYSGHLPIGESWSLGPVVLTRDSDLLEESNHAALIKHLEAARFNPNNENLFNRLGIIKVVWQAARVVRPRIFIVTRRKDCVDFRIGHPTQERSTLDEDHAGWS